MSKLGFKVRRQFGIGRYIVDFYIPVKRIVIEIDGDIHKDPKQAEYDAIRDQFMQNLGYTVCRFTNEQIFGSMDEVLATVTSYLIAAPASTDRSP